MITQSKPNDGLQQALFQDLKQRVPQSHSFVETIAGILQIGTDSAYRRIRGEKAITLDEVARLCDAFEISLDQAVKRGDTDAHIVFSNQVKTGGDFATYLSELLGQTITYNKHGNTMVYFDAKDFAPFQLFHFDFLTRFKMFFWQKAILGYPEFSTMSFEDFEPEQSYMETVRKIGENYCKLPSTEIWSIDTIQTTIRQLEYVKFAGYCREEESLVRVFDEFENLVNHLRAEAESGKKFVYGTKPNQDSGTFNLYYNETYLGNNTVLVTNDHHQQVFMNYNVLSYITSGNESFCRQTRQFFDNAIKKSVLISSVGEKDRNRFFKHIASKFAEARATLLA